MAPLPTLTDRPVTACGLRRLATAVLKTIHGDSWDAGMVNQRARQLENWAVNTGFYDPAQGTVVDCPYGALFAADNEGPPDSTLNQIYDDQWGLLRNAEQALAGARAEHADRGGENALDGSQLSRILAGAGLTVY